MYLHDFFPIMFDINDHVLGFKSSPLVVKCKYCLLVFTSNNRDRWTSHLRASCSDVPDHVKEVLLSMAKKENVILQRYLLITTLVILYLLILLLRLALRDPFFDGLIKLTLLCMMN